MTVKNHRCPVCQENGHDNGSDAGHLFLMEKGDRWCCNRTEHHPDGEYVFYDNDPESNTPVLNDEEFSQGTSSDSEPHSSPFGSTGSQPFGTGQSFNAEPSKRVLVDYRGVPKDVWEEYDTDFTIEDGEVVKQHHAVYNNGKYKGEKVRVVEDKEFVWTKGIKRKDLFGWNTLDGKIPKKLLITEGEMDAASARTMFKRSKYTKNVKVVSGMDGDSVKNIVDNAAKLEKIPELYICPDNDVAGTDYCEKVVSMFPDIKVMSIPLKDANDMLLAGKEEEFVNAFFNADLYKPPSIVGIESLVDSLREFVPQGISTPWSSLDAITYGLVPHQVISVGAGPGTGKSTVVRGLQEHLMFHHKEPIGIFSLEESRDLTLRHLVGYQMNQRIHLPGSTYDVDEAVAHAERLKDRAYIYDRRYFNGSWEKIEKNIRFMYAMGIRYFFIDPVTALVVHLGSSEQNTALGKIMSDLSNLMQELPICVMLVNHLNNPTSGPSHDEGGRVLPSQFTGSKSQWRFSTDMWGFERNILSEDEDEKNTLTVRILKHRTDGSLTGRITKLGFDTSSGKLVEKSSSFKSVDKTITRKKAPEIVPSENSFSPAKVPDSSAQVVSTSTIFGG